MSEIHVPAEQSSGQAAGEMVVVAQTAIADQLAHARRSPRHHERTAKRSASHHTRAPRSSSSRQTGSSTRGLPQSTARYADASSRGRGSKSRPVFRGSVETGRSARRERRGAGGVAPTNLQAPRGARQLGQQIGVILVPSPGGNQFQRVLGAQRLRLGEVRHDADQLDQVVAKGQVR